MASPTEILKVYLFGSYSYFLTLSAIPHGPQNSILHVQQIASWEILGKYWLSFDSTGQVQWGPFSCSTGLSKLGFEVINYRNCKWAVEMSFWLEYMIVLLAIDPLNHLCHIMIITFLISVEYTCRCVIYVFRLILTYIWTQSSLHTNVPRNVHWLRLDDNNHNNNNNNS